MSALPLVQIEGTDGEDLAASFDMTYAGDVNDLLDADWRLTLRRDGDPADVLVDLTSAENPVRFLRVSETPGVAGRVTFELFARWHLIAGRGGLDANGDPLVFAGELLSETYGRREAHARVELALSRAATVPGIWL